MPLRSAAGRGGVLQCEAERLRGRDRRRQAGRNRSHDPWRPARSARWSHESHSRGHAPGPDGTPQFHQFTAKLRRTHRISAFFFFFFFLFFPSLPLLFFFFLFLTGAPIRRHMMELQRFRMVRWSALINPDASCKRSFLERCSGPLFHNGLIWQSRNRSRCHRAAALSRMPSPAARAVQDVAYLFRGALGSVHSRRGMDRRPTAREGGGHGQCLRSSRFAASIADRAIREYREVRPDHLIGHSMGGCAGEICGNPRAEASGKSGCSPSIQLMSHARLPRYNVDRFINIFLSKSVLGGGDFTEPGLPGPLLKLPTSRSMMKSRISMYRKDWTRSTNNYSTRLLQKLATTSAKAKRKPAAIRFCRCRPARRIELWV